MKKMLLFAAFVVAGVSLFAAAKEKFFAYRSFWPESAAMRQFGEAGIDVYAVMPSNSFNTLGEPYCKFEPFWVWDETYLWSVVDKQFDVVLAQNPKAKFICMIDINSPIWLLRRINRKWGMGGDSYQEISNSLCMPEWRELTEKMLKAYVKHMEERYGDKVLYYIVAAGGTSEWYCMSKGRAVPQKEKLWEEWLKKRGLPNWDVPTHKSFGKPAFENYYMDPQTQKPIIEYARFTEELVSKGMSEMSQIVREEVGNKKQVGAFCGFIPMRFTGKLDNRSVFDNKEIDFIGDPGGYDNREIGMGGGVNIPLKSIQLRGKHWFQEIDHSTHTYNYDLTPYVRIRAANHSTSLANNQAETDALLKREFAFATVQQNSLWCFDMWGGIFKTPDTMKLVEKSYKIWDAHKDDNIPTTSEIVFISDPQSGLYSPYLSVKHIKLALYSLGTPFDNLLFDDIGKADFSKYKVIVFPHSFEITPEKKKLLEKYVFNGNKTVITMENFGATDGEKIDTAFTEALTGIPRDSKGVVKKQMDGWKSVYSRNIHNFNKNNLREIAEEAGVHFYTKENVPVYANEKLVSVHVKNGGKKTITLPRKVKKVKELFTDKIVAEDTDKFDYNFSSPDTALFLLQ